MAVDHRVGGLLVFTDRPEVVQTMARWLAATLAGDAATRIVVAGSWLAEDDLWMRVRLEDGQMRAAPGLLADVPAPPVVVVPNLAHAGLGVLRAAVTLVGADVASIERHGLSQTWQPQARWLASANPSSISGHSRHLLERFPLRITLPTEGWPSQPTGPDDWAGLPEPRPLTTPDDSTVPPVAEELLEALAAKEFGGLRRSLAIARTARALAVLEDASEVTTGHLHRALALLGFTDQRDSAEIDRSTAELSDHIEPNSGSRSEATPTEDQIAVASAGPATPVVDATRAAQYPEEAPDSLPEATSLRNPWAGISQARWLRGQNTGVERTRSTVDIALVPTLIEAAKFRSLRPGTTGITIRREDWRRYRRGWRPHRLLTLVLDHTCRRDWDWIPAMVPYLRWAYVQRAAVCVVDLGHAEAVNPLSAERYLVSSLRDPRVLRSLHRKPGRATPLASGIEVAAQELLRLTRRGRANVDLAWLVVATDGRGNVPLDASVRGHVEGPVGRNGVDDALAAAVAVKAMASVRTVVISPQVATYANLPFELADALGGVVATVGSAVSEPHGLGLR
jgi:magnesium chelatase subunit D